jgi:uncharacterized coiled-coil DUF342 family protein
MLAAGFAAAAGLSQTWLMHMILPVVFTLLAAGALFLMWHLRRTSHGRYLAIRELLDAADALETRLRAAREEIEAIAGDQFDPVRGAMQEILRQRLWLREHANDASLEHLQAVRDSLETARNKLEGQLRRIDSARIGPA